MSATVSNKKSVVKEAYQIIRKKTIDLCQWLEIEDYLIQSTYDTSPPKWHLAHTTWFFETFLLQKYTHNYNVFNKYFCYLFNSYYQTVGKFYPRGQRGLISRPTVKTIYDYREYVDNLILSLIDQIDEAQFFEIKDIIILGLNHEQQHQELLLMDIKHNFSYHPEYPSYFPPGAFKNSVKLDYTYKLEFSYVEGGVIKVGHNQPDQFCFDNELPYHSQYLNSYLIANRLITNGEYLEFIQAKGYSKPELWLSDGWDCIQKNQWESPLYWYKIDNQWYIFTLLGITNLDYTQPVSHISYYEADAYARWRGYRLPTEVEWEYATAYNNIIPSQGNFLESEIYNPIAALNNSSELPQQFFGDVWEWTASPYSPYPGFTPLSGGFAEYNGKFMCNQMILKGGSCITPKLHIRTSYRNFFQADKRWQFCGIRLASNLF